VTRGTARYAALTLLLIFFAQAVGAGTHLSLTADEPVHMAQGYVYWTRGDFRLQRPVAQPPLPDLLPGAFLALAPGPEPASLPGWEDADLSRFSRAFVSWYGPRLPAATFAARFPIALVALVGAAFVYRWAFELAGPLGALLALTLLTFDPNTIAHSGLATTDLLLAVWTFVAVYAASRWMKDRGWRWGLLTGLSLGLALGSKTSGFFAVGVVGLLLGTEALGELGQRGEGMPRALLLWTLRIIAAVALGFGVLWALYRFEVRPLRAGGLPVPFATQWVIWDELRSHLAGGHIAYLMGEVSYEGWWYYYPVVFLLKTPLPTLVLLTASFVLALRRGTLVGWWKHRALWLPPLLYAFAAVNSTIDIGYRYLLVALPFLYVAMAGLVPLLKERLRGIVLVSASLTWLVVATLSIAPHYLAYFNALAGGPQGGYRYFVDSNLDWGQGFVALRRWVDENDAEAPLYLSYYTFADPALYGLDYEPIPPARGAPPLLPRRFDPRPGLYAIGATPLQGVMVAEREGYNWFHHREPVARPSHGIFVYRVEPRAVEPGWLAQCNVPVAPLNDAAIVEGFGRSDLRQVRFDCTQSWVYPEGLREPGWYALHGEAAKDADLVAEEFVLAPLSYEQRHLGWTPPFRILEGEAHASSPLPCTPLERPIRVGPLTLLGYRGPEQGSAEPGTTVDLYTCWQVEERPQGAPSIMLHLAAPDGQIVAVGDGLGYGGEMWREGDRFVQRHRLWLPADLPAGEYAPYTGVYDLNSLERWKSPQGEELIYLPLTLALKR
jgi:hypothetical protein